MQASTAVKENEMAKRSLWKRVGGWLGRHGEPMGEGDVERVDAEGLLIEPGEGQEERVEEAEEREERPEEQEGRGEGLLAWRARRDPQLAALEKGFGRLVDVLEAINENVVGQRREMVEVRDQLGAMTRALPGEGQEQAVRELAAELREQAVRQGQVAEQIGRLPELTHNQISKLTEITEQLETSGNTQTRLLESFRRFDSGLEGVNESSREQTAALRALGETSGRASEQMAELILGQNRRLKWFFVAMVVLAVAVLAGAGVVIAVALRG